VTDSQRIEGAPTPETAQSDLEASPQYPPIDRAAVTRVGEKAADMILEDAATG